MNLDDQLSKLKDVSPLVPREGEVRETIQKAREVYFQQEKGRLMTYWEFLWGQFRYTRKRWWALQAGLLLLAWQTIPGMKDGLYRARSVGVLGCLFVVFMIPELWRNRENHSTQVEVACLYSLRQIYAARLTLFGLVDVFLLTLFCWGLQSRSGFTAVEVLSQFLLPATITAGLCLRILCGRQALGEAASLALCLGFSGLWWLVLMNEALYARIVPAAWVALFAAALAFFLLAVRKMVGAANQYWEVDFCETTAG